MGRQRTANRHSGARVSANPESSGWSLTDAAPQILDSGFGLRPPRNDAVFAGARYFAPGVMMARTSAMMSGGVA